MCNYDVRCVHDVTNRCCSLRACLSMVFS